MTIGLKNITTKSHTNPNPQDLLTVIRRRLQGTARGLGYWGARDYAKKYRPDLLLK